MAKKLSDFKTAVYPIDLDGLKVHVTLPAMWNRKYQRRLFEEIGDIDFENASQAEKLAYVDAQYVAFNEVCIVEIEGDDTELPLDLDEYFPLVEQLIVKAQEIADKETEKREAMLKKPQTT